MKRASRRTELRRRLRTLRASLDLSQIDIAQKTTLSESRYWRIENGYDEATPEEQDEIARVLKTTPESIFVIETAVAS